MGMIFLEAYLQILKFLKMDIEIEKCFYIIFQGFLYLMK